MERINGVHHKNLINIRNFVPENGHIRMHTARQHMQKWKPMVAFRLTQILDQFGYNMSDNDVQQWNCMMLIVMRLLII